MSAHTPGPWAWFGDPKYGGFYLATKHSGRRYVMDFVRMGMSKAQPRFQVSGVMIDGKELCRFEVAPAVIGWEAAKKAGSGAYRYDITEFDHPDARLIASAPELLEVLQEIIADGLHCDVVPALHRKALAAIAKATGEGA